MELFSQHSQRSKILKYFLRSRRISTLCPFYLNSISKSLIFNNCFDFRTFLQKITEKKRIFNERPKYLTLKIQKYIVSIILVQNCFFLRHEVNKKNPIQQMILLSFKPYFLHNPCMSRFKKVYFLSYNILQQELDLGGKW